MTMKDVLRILLVFCIGVWSFIAGYGIWVGDWKAALVFGLCTLLGVVAMVWLSKTDKRKEKVNDVSKN